METSMVLSIVFASAVLVLYITAFFYYLTQKPHETVEPISKASSMLMAIMKLFALPAMMLSWSVNSSVWWAVIHFHLSYFYLIYYWLGYGR